MMMIPSEGNRALRSLSPSFSVFRTTTSFCPAFEPKFASFSLYRSSPCHTTVIPSDKFIVWSLASRCTTPEITLIELRN